MKLIIYTFIITNQKINEYFKQWQSLRTYKIGSAEIGNWREWRGLIVTMHYQSLVRFFMEKIPDNNTLTNIRNFN